MTKRYITQPVRETLYLKSGGFCALCKTPLIGNTPSKEIKLSEKAHIQGLNPTAARANAQERNEENLNTEENLIVVCRKCHKMIDSDGQNYGIEFIKAIKREHENDIAKIAEILKKEETKIFIYTNPIDSGQSQIETHEAVKAIVLNNMNPSIHIARIETSAKNEEEDYKDAAKKLEKEYKEKISDKIQEKEIKHISVFSLAPIPLLIKLGSLIEESINTEIYPRQREEYKKTQIKYYYPGKEMPPIEYKTIKPENIKESGGAIIVFNLSGTVPQDHIEQYSRTLTNKPNIWKMTTNRTESDTVHLINCKEDIDVFKKELRKVIDSIVQVYKKDIKEITLLGAIPVVLAIEIGRARLKTAHPKFKILNRMGTNRAFRHALTIGEW